MNRTDTFRSTDGFTLRHIGSQWTDGDLTFESDASGFPVDHLGEQLDGRFVQPVDADLARKLAAAVDWHREFLARGDVKAAQWELEAARKYAAELLAADDAS